MENVKKKTGYVSKAQVMQTATPLLGVVFVFALFTILTNGKILSASNLEVIINQAFSVCLIGDGAIFVFAHGGFDFSVGSCLGVCSLLIAKLLLAGYSPIVALLASMLFGAFSGLCVGAVSEYLGLVPFIASLCFNYIWRGVLQMQLGVENINIPVELCAALNNWWLKLAVLLAVFIIGSFLYNRSRVGKYQMAIGGSTVVAWLSGVHSKYYVILSHVICGVCVGIAALFCVARSARISADWQRI